jgi:hypothetical protein
MPDMQTALKEALNEWSDSAGRHQVEKQQPTPLPEVTQMQNTQTTQQGRPPKQENETDRQEIFYFIKGNPNCSLQDLMDSGFDRNASTHLSTLYFGGKITRKAQQVQRPIYGGRIATRDVFVYAVAVKEYGDVPAVLPNKKAMKIRVHKKVKPAAPQAQGIAALPTEQVEIKPSQGILRSQRIPRPPMETFIPQHELAEAIKPKDVLTAAYVFENISLSEAVKLHAELKKMLG